MRVELGCNLNLGEGGRKWFECFCELCHLFHTPNPDPPHPFSQRDFAPRRYDDRLQAWVRDLVRSLFRVVFFIYFYIFIVIYKGKLSPIFRALFGSWQECPDISI